MSFDFFPDWNFSLLLHLELPRIGSCVTYSTCYLLWYNCWCHRHAVPFNLLVQFGRNLHVIPFRRGAEIRW